MAGKGGKGARPPRQREEPGPRQKVGTARVTGVVQEWKGKFGWIEPDAPINHPEAKKKRGKVFLAQEDVEQDLSGVGCRVSFFLYADGTGLGAMHCVPAGAGGPAGRRPYSGGASGPQRSFQKPPVPTPAPGRPKAAPMKPPPGGKSAGGKGSQAAEDARRSRPPDPAARTTISTAPVQGKVIEWRGKFGFIRPDEPLEIPEEADKKKLGNKFKIYCHASDVEGEMPLKGAVVIFFVYSDPNGIGAEMCQVVEQGEADGSAAPAAAEEAADADADMDAEDGQAPKGGGKSAKKRGGKGQDRKKDGQAPGAAKKNSGPSGPDLPRTRVSDTQVTGEVANWKGKFGWIKPTEEIDHPDVKKHKGDVYVHKNDLVGVEALEKGQSVQFFVFSDASGLGAEEVSLL